MHSADALAETIRARQGDADMVNAPREANESDVLMTPKEVATRLRVGRSAVYEWLASGRLPHYRLGRTIRIRREDVDQLLESSREERPVWRRYGPR